MYQSGLCGSGFGPWMGHGPWMFFIPVLVLLALAILFTRGRNTGPVNVGTRVDEALELLRRRYAAGELSEEDFQVMKNNLHK